MDLPKSAYGKHVTMAVESDLSDVSSECTTSSSTSSSSRYSKISMINKIFRFGTASEDDDGENQRIPFRDANVVSIGGYHAKKSSMYQSFHGDTVMDTTDFPDEANVQTDLRAEAMKEMCSMP